MKRKNLFLLIVLFAIFFAYITNIEKIPNNITLYQNEKLEIGHLKGLKIDGEKISTKDNFWNKLVTVRTDMIGKIELKLSALNIFNKKITVNVVPAVEVVPGGDCIGVKLYSKGVLIIGESKVQGIDGEFYELYEEGTFKPGDILLKINDYEIESAEDVSRVVDYIGNEEVILTCERNEKIFETKITPIRCIDDGKYKLGVWVRDGAMGVGTLTFYLPQTNSFAALGHGISDEDSKSLIKLEDGNIYDASVLSVSKGLVNRPGELKGFLNEETEIGTIKDNSNIGIYGICSGENFQNRARVTVASKNEIQTGPATILCTIDESQIVKEYDIEIIRLSNSSFAASKGMVIKVTDEELLKKTGGIIQGMSGSPILQNGKLIGAITHVYVNDPTKGYAIFADTMIAEANSFGEDISVQ